MRGGAASAEGLWSVRDLVRQAKPGFSIDLKCDHHVKKVSNM